VLQHGLSVAGSPQARVMGHQENPEDPAELHQTQAKEEDPEEHHLHLSKVIFIL